MLSRTLMQIFILAHAPRLLCASLAPHATTEGAQMRNKHAPPGSKKTHHMHVEHAETFVQAHKHEVEVDHQGLAKKRMKTVQPARSPDKAPAHAGGFAEDASNSKNAGNIHADARGRVSEEKAVQDVGGSAATIASPTPAPTHSAESVASHNMIIFSRAGWENESGLGEGCQDHPRIQKWLENNEVEMRTISSYKAFATLQTSVACANLCDTHATGDHPCVAIAHTEAPGRDGKCNLFSSRDWKSEFATKMDGVTAAPTTDPNGASAVDKPWKCFFKKPQQHNHESLAGFANAAEASESTVQSQGQLLSQMQNTVTSLADRVNAMSSNTANES